MSGFLQTLAGGVVGAGAVLAALYLPPLVAPEPRPEPAPAAAEPADPFGPGAVILTEGDAACPDGWVAAGRTALSVAEAPGGEAGGAASAPAAPASRAFTLCRREDG